MAVMNMPEEMVVVWKHVFMMYAPSFFSVPFFGSLPHARHRDCVGGACHTVTSSTSFARRGRGRGILAEEERGPLDQELARTETCGTRHALLQQSLLARIVRSG